MIEYTRAQKIRCLAATLHALQEMERIVANEATTYEGDHKTWDAYRDKLRVDIVSEVSDQAINEGLDDEDILHLLQELKAAADRERELVWEPGKPLWLSTEVNDIAKYCTDALQYNLCKPTEQAARRVPDELTTPEAKKCFAKALQVGYMTEVEGGYKWVYCNGLKASLGYFLHKVFSPDGCSTIPYKELERLFGVSRLDRTIDQVVTSTNKQKWREAIDRLFE